MMAREIFPRPEDGRIHLEPVDAGREQKFREEALERLFVGRTLDARLVAAEVESDQSSELDFGVRLAEARVGERILAFRDALRIETHYGLAPKTLYSGLTQEELGDLSDDERVGMFSLQAGLRCLRKHFLKLLEILFGSKKKTGITTTLPVKRSSTRTFCAFFAGNCPEMLLWNHFYSKDGCPGVDFP
jgi:hypothetical protein